MAIQDNTVVLTTWTLCKKIPEHHEEDVDIKDTKHDLVSARISHVLCTSFSELVCCIAATRSFLQKI